MCLPCRDNPWRPCACGWRKVADPSSSPSNPTIIPSRRLAQRGMPRRAGDDVCWRPIQQEDTITKGIVGPSLGRTGPPRCCLISHMNARSPRLERHIWWQAPQLLVWCLNKAVLLAQRHPRGRAISARRHLCIIYKQCPGVLCFIRCRRSAGV